MMFLNISEIIGIVIIFSLSSIFKFARIAGKLQTFEGSINFLMLSAFVKTKENGKISGIRTVYRDIIKICATRMSTRASRFKMFHLGVQTVKSIKFRG